MRDSSEFYEDCMEWWRARWKLSRFLHKDLKPENIMIVSWSHVPSVRTCLVFQSRAPQARFSQSKGGGLGKKVQLDFGTVGLLTPCLLEAKASAKEHAQEFQAGKPLEFS